MMKYITILGIVGAAFILFAFLMNQFHKWLDDSKWYDGINVLGGGLLVIYSYLLHSWPFLILNGVWTIVSLRDVFLDSSRKKKGRLGHRKK